VVVSVCNPCAESNGWGIAANSNVQAESFAVSRQLFERVCINRDDVLARADDRSRTSKDRRCQTSRSLTSERAISLFLLENKVSAF